MIDDLECIICSDDITFKTTLMCKHSFCTKCIFKWMTASETCPLCRSNIIIKNKNDTNLCTICNKQMDFKSELLCKHNFCSQCILPVIKTTNKCPDCNHILTEEFIDDSENNVITYSPEDYDDSVDSVDSHDSVDSVDSHDSVDSDYLNTLTRNHGQEFINNVILDNILYIACSSGEVFNLNIRDNCEIVINTIYYVESYNGNYNSLVHEHIELNDITTLIFGTNNINLNPGDIPETIEEIQFIYLFNKIIPENIIQSEVKTIVFGHYYNQIIGVNVLPQNLHKLEFTNFIHIQLI